MISADSQWVSLIYTHSLSISLSLSLAHTHIHTHAHVIRHACTLSFFQRKTELLTRSPELPPSSDHQLKFLWRGLVISLMLLLAVCYRFHYCRSMQSPCEVGGGKQEEKKRRDESFLLTDLSTCLCSQEILLKGAGTLLQQLRQERLGSCCSDWKEIWKPFSSEQNKMLSLFLRLCFCWWCALPSWLAIVLSGYRSCFQCRTPTPFPFFFLWVSILYFPMLSPVIKHTSLFNFILAFSFRIKLNKKSQRTNLFPLLPPSFNPLYSPHPPTPTVVLDWCHRDRIQSGRRITFSLPSLQLSLQFKYRTPRI